MQSEPCPYRASIAFTADWSIPRPSPETIAMFQNTNRNSLLFLHAARIQPNSTEHKELKKTIQALHRQCLNPFKYTEEQASTVNQVIAKARCHLPWLAKYEDTWPARIYLKRYVDTRRPHLRCTRYHRAKQSRTPKSSDCKQYPQPTEDLPVHDTPRKDHGSSVQEFLGSLIPSLEHHLDAFIELGIKDQKTLQAFLSWPPLNQARFLDDFQAVLKLTSLEKNGLLLGSSQLTQRTLERSFDAKLKRERFPSQVTPS